MQVTAKISLEFRSIRVIVDSPLTSAIMTSSFGLRSSA